MRCEKAPTSDQAASCHGNSGQLSRRVFARHMTALGITTWTAPYCLPADAASLHVGQPAPPAVLECLDGRRLSTSDLLGQVVILTFWATWCSPCRDELRLLSDYLTQHAGHGLAVLAFSLDDTDNLASVRQVSRAWSFPVGLLDAQSAPGYGRIWRIPVNFTIGRDGTLIDNGWADRQPVWTRDRLDRIVSPLLAG